MVASAAVIGLCVPIAVVAAPHAAAEPCTGAAASAQPGAGQAVEIPSPSALAPFDRPIGHKPSGANEQAPLPKLGQLPLAILKALVPRPTQAQVQQQAAVAPVTPTPAPAPQPAPVAAQPPPPSAPPGTSIVGWVTGPDSPNQTMQKFAITGTDLGIMWDNGDPEQAGPDGVRRHVRLLRNTR